MLHRTSLIAITCFTLASAASAAVLLPSNFVNQTVVGGLSAPRAMAFLPDGRVLITEQRTGRVRTLVNGHVAATDPALIVPTLDITGNERGLQGIAVDPGWPTRPYVYVYYTRTGLPITIERYTATGSLSDPIAEDLKLSQAFVLIANIPDENPNHNAGCLRFGPDGYLYAGLGEDFDACNAQDSTRLKGEILRLDVSRLPAGAGGPPPRALLIPAGNPLSSPDSNARLVWAYGLRNPWLFQIDPLSGLIYAADPGDHAYEEIDEVRPGDDLGWPWREGIMVQSNYPCPEPGGPGANAYRSPIYWFAHGGSSTAIVCGGIYRPPVGAASQWPSAYRGDVFVGEYFTGFLRRLKFNGSSWSVAAPVPGQPSSGDWADSLTAATDFLIGQDGSLWWLQQYDASFGSSTGSLNRILYTGPPVAAPLGSVDDAPLSASPDPFHASTALSFRLAVPGAVRLAVFDVSGRRVRTLLDVTLAAGRRSVVWDGRDGSGRALAPGLFFARLDRPARAETVRLLRLR